MRALTLPVIALAAAASLCRPASAETLTPKEIQYEFAQTNSGGLRKCSIVLLLLNVPSPETVNFQLMVIHKPPTGPSFAGFSMDVGDLKFVNGLPGGAQKATLASAAFVSPSFSSVGRLNGGPVADGGVLQSSADPATIAGFVIAFSSGNFALSFVRDGVPGSRTYQVASPPPPDVRQQFYRCVEALGK